eukprot:1269875-Amphidinium_carterae.1
MTLFDPFWPRMVFSRMTMGRCGCVNSPKADRKTTARTCGRTPSYLSPSDESDKHYIDKP